MRTTKISALILGVVLLSIVPALAVEMVIMAYDKTNANPDVNTRLCWKRGDLVDVGPDGKDWGSEVMAPPATSDSRHVIVRITNVTVGQARAYLQEHIVAGDIALRSRFHVNWQALPAGVRNTLWTTGYYENTWANIKPYIYDKLTGSPVP